MLGMVPGSSSTDFLTRVTSFFVCVCVFIYTSNVEEQKRLVQSKPPGIVSYWLYGCVELE
jgi:hypothetical protein